MKNWPNYKNKKLKLYCYFKEEFQWWNKMFRLTYYGKNSNWDYQWTFKNFYKKRLSIVPKKNLISNIGVDGHGKNSGKLFNLKTYKIKFPLNHPKNIELNYRIDKLICKKTYVMPKISFRIKNKIIKIFKLN